VRTVAEDHVTAGQINWADIVVFSCLPAELRYRTRDLEKFITGGGKVIFFATTIGNSGIAERLTAGGKVIFFATTIGNSGIAERLWREGVLPVLPERWVEETMYPYRPDRIAVRGCWLCRAAPETRCVWRFNNGPGFLYSKSAGLGSSVLVNTSIDDSLGLLAKSGAWVAFCSYLLGEDRQTRQFSFCGKTRARIEGDRLFLPAPTGLGWMKTLGSTALYAGINLPAGETDIGHATPELVADALTRAFVTAEPSSRDPEQARASLERKPIWKTLAWIIILLVLMESTVTSRLKR